MKKNKTITPQDLFDQLCEMNRVRAEQEAKCTMCDRRTKEVWNGSYLCKSCQDKFKLGESNGTK